MRTVIVSIFLSLAVMPAFSQEKKDSLLLDKTDTLFFMNGEFLNAHILDTANFMVHFKYVKKHKEHDLSVERERLFGIKYGNGTERIYYYYDTLVGNYFTVEETKKFIYGEHDAIKGYKPRLDMAGGFLIGLGSTIKDSLFSIPTILVPIPILAFTALVTLVPRVRGNKKKITNVAYLKEDSYLIGYERVARKKKCFYALTGGVAGLLTGVAINTLLLGQKIQ